MSARSAVEELTLDTLSAITKAQTNGILSTTGLVSYDLTGVVQLIPVFTPLRSHLPREAATDGAKFAIWRAIMDVTNSQPRATPGWGRAGNEVIFSEQDFQAAYRPVAYAGLVEQDAVDIAKGLDDPYAQATFTTLNQMLIGEDRLLVGSQAFILPRPAAPTLGTANSGGSIAASTLMYVGVAARTASGYYWGGNSQGNSASLSSAAGTATNVITATLAAVKGAVAYDWFGSTDNVNYYYVRTTTITSTTFTAIPVANAATTQSLALPIIYTGIPTYLPGADNGSCPLDPTGDFVESNGLIATLTGDFNTTGSFVTAGTATVNGATYIDGGGAALTLVGGSVSQIEALFAGIWNKIYASPSALMMNAVQAQEIANLVLGSSSATTFLTTDEAGRISTTAGGRVGQIVNTPAGGVTVPIEVHGSIPPGTIIARTAQVPFPQAGITNTLAVRTLRDYQQFDYGIGRATGASGGPRKEFEIRSVQTLVNRAPVSMGILVNIS
jgi:hypothetical protein